MRTIEPKQMECFMKNTKTMAISCRSNLNRTYRTSNRHTIVPKVHGTRCAVPLLIAVIAIVTAIGFSTTACEEEDDGGNGVLTIEGLDNYNGKYALAVRKADKSMLVAAEIYSTMGTTCGEIIGGSVSLKVWKVNTSNDKKITAAGYSGNDSVTFDVMISKDANVDVSNYEEQYFAGIGTVKVTFKKGVASGVFAARPNNDNIGIGIATSLSP